MPSCKKKIAIKIENENQKEETHGRDSAEFYKNLHDHVKQDLVETNEIVINDEKETKTQSVLNVGKSGYLEENVSQADLLKHAILSMHPKVKNWEMVRSQYCFDFSRNSQRIVLGGQNGILKSSEWKADEKKFIDIRVSPVNSVTYLHKLSMVAAGGEYLNIYGEQGKEMHEIRKVYKPISLQFLPYHYVLACGSETGYLSFVDTAVGNIISSYATFRGPVSVMCQNRRDATICTAQKRGCVTMWTPNTKKPVLKFIINSDANISAIDIDYTGNYVSTFGSNRKVKTFDIRQVLSGNPKAITELYTGPGEPVSVSYSQTGLLAIAAANHVRVLKNVYMLDSGGKKNYEDHMHLKHSFYQNKQICQVQFCPFEDILGVSTNTGFHTLIVPGSGSSEHCEYEDNVMINTAEFRRVDEVKRALARVPPETIRLNVDYSNINRVNVDVSEDEDDDDKDRKKMFGGKNELQLIKKKSHNRKPKPVNGKILNKKDNLYHERVVKKRKLLESEIYEVPKKAPKERALTNTALDNLLYAKK